MATFDITEKFFDEEKSLVGVFSTSKIVDSISIYRMRAYNTNLSQYVFWNSNSRPDTTGILSGYNIADLSRITVVSRIDNV